MKLSIITVNLNNLEGLKKTYESVVSQTFTDYEWIVIDGGSTDGSREFIEQHQDKFAYWCSEPDKGIYNAMNKGIVRAKGEYLNFMNSGDCFACEETLARVFSQERTADILYGLQKQFVDKGKWVYTNLKLKKIKWFNLYMNTLPHQSSFIKTTCFRKIGLYDEKYRIIADWKWFIAAILNYRVSYEFIPIEIAIFEGNGLSSPYNIQTEEATMKEEFFPKFISNEDMQDLMYLSYIRSYKLTNCLFKLLLSISYRATRFRQKTIYHF